MHGVVIHKGSVTLKVELAECENSQSNEGDGENQTQQGVRCTTTFCNTEDREGGGEKKEEVVSKGWLQHKANKTPKLELQPRGCKNQHTSPAAV